MKSLIPVSKAKTAYGLLSEIATLALAEPKRMRMAVFLDTRAAVHWGDHAPACGTVGCIAGWTCVLTGNNRGVWPVMERAMDVLGLSYKEGAALFLIPRLCNEEKQGTAVHARHVVAHIRRFQKRYATQLKAKKV